MERYTQACSLDCYDCCKLNIYKENNKIVKIEGNKENSFTKGNICIKGIKHLERLYDENRLKTPLLKIDGKFKEISFEEALNLIAEKLKYYKKNYGTTSIINYDEAGSSNFLKGIESIFFNFYGGVTSSKGSTCWGAGNAAQDYDFGNKLSNSIDDILNAKTAIMWGRNPFNTSIHLYNKLVEAKEKGVQIITIDPRQNETSKIANKIINIVPSCDGAFAMAISKYIIENNLEDKEFIKSNTYGYEEYKSYLESLSLDYLLEECEITNEELKNYSEIFINGPVTVYLGYGMQKYYNSGNTIRAIDALMAITGNIGKKGAGCFYANNLYSSILNKDPYNSKKYVKDEREFWVSDFVGFINRVKENNPVKAIFISKANSMNQFPNLNESIEVFNSIEFKVNFDMFLTDTGKYCDLIIPVTNPLESEDLRYSSMHNPYITYNEKVIEPQNKLFDEYFFFQELAKKMEIFEYPQVTKKEYINKVIAPLNLTIEKLKENDFTLQKEIAWEDKVFKTPSKKFEFYSKKALEDGVTPTATYISSKMKMNNETLRLLTPHPKNSLFSQHMKDIKGVSKIFVPIIYKNKYVEGELVKVSSELGEINSEIYFNETLRKDVAYMYIGWHHKHGNPNFLTKNGISEMGGQVTYGETYIKIEKLN